VQCSADDSVKGTVATTEIKQASAAGVKKALIIYYSWGGNTRGVAKEIARQTGFDSIELELVTPYSTNYNTVLNEAQRDQHKQARPALKTKIARENGRNTTPSSSAIRTGGLLSRCRLRSSLKATIFREKESFRSALTAEEGSGRALRQSQSLPRMLNSVKGFRFIIRAAHHSAKM